MEFTRCYKDENYDVIISLKRDDKSDEKISECHLRVTLVTPVNDNHIERVKKQTFDKVISIVKEMEIKGIEHFKFSKSLCDGSISFRENGITYTSQFYWVFNY